MTKFLMVAFTVYKRYGIELIPTWITECPEFAHELDTFYQLIDTDRSKHTLTEFNTSMKELWTPNLIIYVLILKNRESDDIEPWNHYKAVSDWVMSHTDSYSPLELDFIKKLRGGLLNIRELFKAFREQVSHCQTVPTLLVFDPSDPCFKDPSSQYEQANNPLKSKI